MTKKLNNKIWFRFLKVVFIVCFVISQILGIGLALLLSDQTEVVYVKRDENGFIPACKDGSKPSSVSVAEFGICYERKFSNLQTVLFCVIAFVIISCIFKLIVKTFYYIVLG